MKASSAGHAHTTVLNPRLEGASRKTRAILIQHPTGPLRPWVATWASGSLPIGTGTGTGWFDPAQGTCFVLKCAALVTWTRVLNKGQKITKKHWRKKTENPTEKRKECFPYHMGTSIFAGSDSIRRSSCRFHMQDFLGICRCQWSPSHGRESAHVPILRIGHGLERVEGDLLLLLHQHQHPKCSLACQAGRRGWVHLVGLLMAVVQMAQFPVAVQVLGLVLLVELHLPKSACWNIFWDLDFLYWDNCEESSPVLVWVHLIAFRPTSLATFGRCCVSHIPSPMRPAL